MGSLCIWSLVDEMSVRSVLGCNWVLDWAARRLSISPCSCVARHLSLPWSLPFSVYRMIPSQTPPLIFFAPLGKCILSVRVPAAPLCHQLSSSHLGAHFFCALGLPTTQLLVSTPHNLLMLWLSHKGFYSLRTGRVFLFHHCGIFST